MLMAHPADICYVLLAPNKASLKDQALRSLEKLPPFSPVLSRLLATLAQEDVSFANLADLIEKDTVLAGNVLKLVNSAAYGRSGNVNSVRHAVSILGVTKLRNATLGMSVTRMWTAIQTAPGWSVPRFNQHSIGTAILADLLSQEAQVEYPEGAFVAGLLHDVGRLLTAVALPDEHNEVDNLCRVHGGPQAQYEQEILGFTHGELSGAALISWNLPLPIQMAVRYHHAPDSDVTQAAPGVVRLSKLIQVTDEYVDSRGISVEPPAVQAQPDVGCLGALGIGGKLARILGEFESEFESIRKLF